MKYPLSTHNTSVTFHAVNTFLPAHPPSEQNNINFSSDVRQLLCLIKLPPRLMFENQTVYEYFHSLYIILRLSLWKSAIRRYWPEPGRSSEICRDSDSGSGRASGVLADHDLSSVCPHPAPSCQQLSEPEWSVELLQHSQAPVCRLQSPLKPVPRLPPPSTHQPPDGEH